MNGTSPRQTPVHILTSLANKRPCILVTLLALYDCHKERVQKYRRTVDRTCVHVFINLRSADTPFRPVPPIRLPPHTTPFPPAPTFTTTANIFVLLLLLQVCQREGVQEYRTVDGTCNHVFNLGSANTPLRRMLPPVYDDGE